MYNFTGGGYMGGQKFAIKTLKSDKKQSLFFICSIMFSVAVVF